MNTIPKIIHQTGPSEKSNWHPLWFKCQESWLKHFPDFEYKLWNDEEIDNLVKDEYPQYWEMYNNFPAHIMKIDFVRFCFMDKFGGIYVDLDFFCYKNFEKKLTKKIHLVENPFGNDPIENSLMCSVPNTVFFKKCMDRVAVRYNEIKESYPDKLEKVRNISNDPKFSKILRPYLIFYISGTNLLSTIYRENQTIVHTLPGFTFNNLDFSYDESFYTKHIHTGTWGKENLNAINKDEHFKHIRNIPSSGYNFYYDYSGGKFKEVYEMDFDKNNVESFLPLDNRYAYS